MTAKLITFDTEARRALERGLDQVARAVKITMKIIDISPVRPRRRTHVVRGRSGAAV